MCSPIALVRRPLLLHASLLCSFAISACAGDGAKSLDMSLDSAGSVDAEEPVDQRVAADLTPDSDGAGDSGVDSTSSPDGAPSNDASGSGCPAPSSLPAQYACIEVAGLGVQLLQMQDTSAGNGFFAKTSGPTPGWDQLVIVVNLESAATYECHASFTEIQYTTKVATANETKYVANDAAQSCQIVVTRAAVNAGQAYQGTFSTALPLRMSGSFHGRHD